MNHFTSPSIAEPSVMKAIPLLELKKVSAFYGSAQALFELSFSLDQGEVLALVGPNGAGKSTTLKSIVSWVDRWEGEIFFQGQPLTSLESHQIAARGIALVPEDRRIFTSLSVEENLDIGRQVLRQKRDRGLVVDREHTNKGGQAWDLDAVLALFPALGSMLKRPAGQMSGGEQQMLAIGRALMGNPDVLLLEPEVFSDNRGFFFESFRLDQFQQVTEFKSNFVQDNHSKSSRGILRGLHYQLPPYGQGKLVRVIQGEVIDVAVDLRQSSPTFGQYVAEILSSENKKQMWIPEGFAHGFLTLSETSEFLYKTTIFYNASSERTILWNDKTLNIDWGYLTNLQLSEKDLSGLGFQSSEVFP